MERIADKKLHFAPYERQARAISTLVRENRFRDRTEFLRAAIDHYLDHLGRPPLSKQARQMAEDFERAGEEGPWKESGELQRASMASDEDW